MICDEKVYIYISVASQSRRLSGSAKNSSGQLHVNEKEHRYLFDVRTHGPVRFEARNRSTLSHLLFDFHIKPKRNGVILFKRRLAGLLTYSIVSWSVTNLCAFVKRTRNYFANVYPRNAPSRSTDISWLYGEREREIESLQVYPSVLDDQPTINYRNRGNSWKFRYVNYTDASCRLGRNYKIISNLRISAREDSMAELGSRVLASSRGPRGWAPNYAEESFSTNVLHIYTISVCARI